MTAGCASFANCMSKSDLIDAGTLSRSSGSSSLLKFDGLLGYQSTRFNALESSEDFTFGRVVCAAGILQVHCISDLKLLGKQFQAKIKYWKHTRSIYPQVMYHFLKYLNFDSSCFIIWVALAHWKTEHNPLLFEYATWNFWRDCKPGDSLKLAKMNYFKYLSETN